MSRYAPEKRSETMTPSTSQCFPLASAYLCQDCESVSNSAMACPACASSVLMGLSGVLDRTEEKPKALPRLWWLSFCRSWLDR